MSSNLDKFQEIPNIALDRLFRFPVIIIDKYLINEIPEEELQRFYVKSERTRHGGEFRKIEIDKDRKKENLRRNKIKSVQLGFNTRTGLILYYETIPVALIGFIGDYIDEDKCLFLNQIQLTTLYDNMDIFYKNKVSETYVPNDYCKDFNWKKVLVKVCEIYAKHEKYEKIAISTSKAVVQNRDNQYREGLDLKRANGIYDKTALEMGYKPFNEMFFLKDLN